MDEPQSCPTGLSLSIPSTPTKTALPPMYKTPSLRVRTERKVLEGTSSRPFRRSHIKRMLRSFRPNTEVKVQPSPYGVAAAVLYATEDDDSDFLVPTTIVSGIPEPGDKNLVYQDSPYEVRVVGMHVPNFDSWGPYGDNELFMYSQDTTEMTEPTVHYDYESGSECNQKESVNMRFCILELDKPGQMTKAAINGIGDVGRLVRAVPAVQAAAPALKLASAMSKRALHAYAKPDKVIMVDADFAIADRAKLAMTQPRAGEYLRYGYYFFLSEPIEGQLYASVRTVKNVRLMFKREKHDHHARSRWPFAKSVEAKKFFPLADVSYIVVRVTEPMGSRKSNALKDGEAIRKALASPTLTGLFPQP